MSDVKALVDAHHHTWDLDIRPQAWLHEPEDDPSAAPCRPAIINATLGERSQQQAVRNAELHRRLIPHSFWDSLRAQGLIRSDVPAANGPGRSARCL